MMMHKWTSLLVILFGSLFLLEAQERENPTMPIFYGDTATEITVGGNYTKQSESLYSFLGNGGYRLSVDAISLLPLDHQITIWGEAGYKMGQDNNIRWNETSDAALLYPYLSADSLGGYMKSESYFFKGGYAQELGQLYWGAEINYRALLEYRDVDPRPKNTVADFNLSAALGWKFNSRQGISLALSGKRYKQNSSIQYYSELGQSKTYHFTGLGNDYARFSGTNNQIFYSGYAVGTSLDYQRLKSQGFTATLAYRLFTFDKILTGLNNVSMATLNEHKFEGAVGHTDSNWEIHLKGIYKQRIGTEHIYGDAANNSYPLLTSSDMYRDHNLYVALDAPISLHKSAKSKFLLTPWIGYQNLELSYASPYRLIGSQFIEGGIHLNYEYKKDKFRVYAHILGNYKYAMITESVWSDFSESDITYSNTLNNATSLQSGSYHIKANLKCYIPINESLSWIIQLEGGYQHYLLNRIDCNHISFRTGLSF